MAQYTDEEILFANQGRIEPGDYVVFKGNLVIKWVSKDVAKVNIIYEKTQGATKTDTNIAQNVVSDTNNVNSYTWLVPFAGNPQYVYPTYRIKIVSTVSNNVVAYSNPFKVSVDMTSVINNEEE